ncbi:class I SAM-dependent methyltransferase [Staphylococcus warneri]|uniref:class I SAM-dependent methyltransferase n=1 Tax=Staphylococcus warneri TaxID=1292 RepID=UPI0013F145FE|nr:class I SAM-dependent methyltransferase [Staphylococcus warneri]
MENYSETMIAVLLARVENSKISKENYPNKLIDKLNHTHEHFEFLEYKSRGMFSRSILVRSLYFIDSILNFKGEQIIVLGSGLDTKALEYADENVSIHYVDHPQSIDFSKELLRTVDHGNIEFTSFDLEDDANFLLQKLNEKGIDKFKDTLIIWEGSSYYINPKSSLNLIASLIDYFENFNFYFDILCSGAYQNSSKGANENIKYLKNINETWVGHLIYEDIKDIVCNAKKNRINLKKFDRSEIELKYLKESYLFSGQMSFIEIEKEF